jgi:hypothetical protein
LEAEENFWQTSGASRGENAQPYHGNEMSSKHTLVMPGLDPGIHHSSQKSFEEDGFRVKPGNDELD